QIGQLKCSDECRIWLLDRPRQKLLSCQLLDQRSISAKNLQPTFNIKLIIGAKVIFERLAADGAFDRFAICDSFKRRYVAVEVVSCGRILKCKVQLWDHLADLVDRLQCPVSNLPEHPGQSATQELAPCFSAADSFLPRSAEFVRPFLGEDGQ